MSIYQSEEARMKDQIHQLFDDMRALHREKAALEEKLDRIVGCDREDSIACFNTWWGMTGRFMLRSEADEPAYEMTKRAWELGSIHATIHAKERARKESNDS